MDSGFFDGKLFKLSEGCNGKKLEYNNEGFRDAIGHTRILQKGYFDDRYHRTKGSLVEEFNIKDDIVLNIHDCNFHLATYTPHIVKRSRGWSWYNRKTVDIEKIYTICFFVYKNII